MAERIGERSASIEAARRLPVDLVDELRASGLFRMSLPRELGGHEADPVETISAVEALSAADGSVGWCAAVAVGTNALSAYLPESGARQIFAGADVVTGGSFNVKGRARPVDGGFVVSGRWGFGSGADHNDWMCGGCVVVDDGGEPRLGEDGKPEVILAFFPMAQATVIDTWHVSGLRGTGSHDVAVDELRVPVAHTTPFTFVAWPAGTLWRLPPLALIFGPMAAVPLGMARAAITELVAMATEKTPYRSTRRLAERDVVQTMVARAEAAVRSARALLIDAVGEVRDTAAAGEPVTLRQRAVVRLATVHATRAAADAVDLCYEAGGATSIFTTSPLQRHFRDVHAATQHVVLAHSGWETVGRVLLGLDPDTSLI